MVFVTNQTVKGTDFDAIQDAIDSSQNNDMVLLGSTTYSSGGRTIEVAKKNLTIQGQSNSNRATLDGNGLNTTLIVRTGSTVVLRYINFVNCTSINNHALDIHGEVIIENCTFSNCYGNGGSAIYLSDDALVATIIDCTFINNTATSDGGAISSYGSSNLKLINCYFENNTALNSGGAVGIRNNGVNTEIINCIFFNNTATYGGALYIVGSTTIRDSKFINNRASRNGGAIFASGTSLLTVLSSNFTNNTATNSGGAIYSTTRINIRDNCVFNNNRVNNGNGGAISSEESLNIMGAFLKITMLLLTEEQFHQQEV